MMAPIVITLYAAGIRDDEFEWTASRTCNELSANEESVSTQLLHLNGRREREARETGGNIGTKKYHMTATDCSLQPWMCSCLSAGALRMRPPCAHEIPTNASLASATHSELAARASRLLHSRAGRKWNALSPSSKEIDYSEEFPRRFLRLVSFVCRAFNLVILIAGSIEAQF